MKDNVKVKSEGKLFDIGNSVVKILSIIFLFVLAVTGLFLYVKEVDWNEWFKIIKDPVYTLFSLLCFTIMFIVFKKIISLLKTRRNKEITCILFLSLLFILLMTTKPYPAGDQEYIYQMINYLKEYGAYSKKILPTDNNYHYLFNMYVDEFGNVANNIMFQYLFKDYNRFYVFNFILYILAFHFWIKSLTILKINDKQIDSFMILYSLCTPLFLYVCFYYGEITGLFGITLSIYLIIRILNGTTNKMLNYILLFLINLIMVIEKENTLIFVIAEVLCMILFILNKNQKQNLKNYISVIICIVLSAMIVNPIVNLFCSSNNMKRGQTNTLAYLAMGMHDNVADKSYLEGTGIGIEGGYDATNRKYFYSDELNEYVLRNVSKNDYKEDINYSFNNFINHPDYAIRFYFNKIIKQWNTNDFNTGPNIRHISENNSISKIDEFNMFLSNGERMFIYLTVFFIILFNLSSNDYNVRICSTILLVLFIGNFLFSIIWEAKPRYCIYGYYGLLLYLSLNVDRFFELIQSRFKTLMNRIYNSKERNKHA